MTPRTMVAMSVGLVLLGGCTGSRSAATPARTPLAASSARSLYRLDSQTTTWRLTPLDWATLRDTAGAASLSGKAEDVVASGDGSTLAALTGGTSTTAVRILDAASGAVRSRYEVRSSRGTAALSFDGSRLALEEDAGPFGATRWHVSDARDGRSLGSLDVSDGGVEVWNASLTGGFRLLTPGDGQSAVGPVHPIVAVDDLSRGGEAGRLRLDDAFAGLWRSTRPPVGSEQVMDTWEPGVALSPDGTTAAVVYADGDRLALVDLSRLLVRSTVTVQRQQSWIERIGLHVRDVEAKAMDGWLWNAAFTRDGRLLTWGTDLHMTDQGQLVMTGVGLRLIDPVTGVILQEALKGEAVEQVLPTPDGSAIMAVGTAQDGSATLVRLDAGSLAVQASRQLPADAYHQVLVLAARAQG